MFKYLTRSCFCLAGTKFPVELDAAIFMRSNIKFFMTSSECVVYSITAQSFFYTHDGAGL